MHKCAAAAVPRLEALRAQPAEPETPPHYVVNLRGHQPPPHRVAPDNRFPRCEFDFCVIHVVVLLIWKYSQCSWVELDRTTSGRSTFLKKCSGPSATLHSLSVWFELVQGSVHSRNTGYDLGQIMQLMIRVLFCPLKREFRRINI